MSDHLVDVVNEKDEVIGSDYKSNKVEKGFISRVAAVFLCDSEGKFIICKRAPHKKFSPNLYDLAAAGNVLKGESYEEAASRELHEELKIACNLQKLDVFYQEAEGKENRLKYFCGVFLGETDEKPVLNEELSEMRKLTLAQLRKELNSNRKNFCPGFINDFYQVEKKLENILSKKQ